MSVPHRAIVGRQPIFDRRLRLYGYELLFRTDPLQECAVVTQGDACTARVLVNTFIDIGLENVVGSAFAFINVDREFLLGDSVAYLPGEKVVLEILEHVPPEPDVLDVLRKLVSTGYRLALDDFVFREDLRPFLDLASIVKTDLTGLDRDGLAEHVASLRRPGVTLVAERVETRADFDACRRAGFDYFQGYFLARPATLERPRSPDGNRLTALQILTLLDNPNESIDTIEAAISRDVTLGYRLLRLINSAAFGMSRRIDSLRQAIVHLGRARIRAWVSLLVLSGLSDKSSELVATGLMRARMCERLGQHLEPEHGHSYFTAGLFSILDAVLDVPMDRLVGALPLSPAVGEALVDRTGPIGEALSLVISYEQCQWDALDGGPVSATLARDAYLDAVKWAMTLQAAADVPAAGARGSARRRDAAVGL